MKPFAILVAAMATISAAIVVPSQDAQPIQDRGVVHVGTDFTSGLLGMIARFPGTKEIKETFICMRKDKHWNVDYSQKDDGIVIFTDVDPKCCNTAQDGWKKYQKDWSKFATPVFNDGCTGGALTKMGPAHIDKLHRMIGDGKHRP